MAIDDPFDAVDKQYPDGPDAPFAEFTDSPALWMPNPYVPRRSRIRMQ
jgi:hypothetical protein